MKENYLNNEYVLAFINIRDAMRQVWGHAPHVGHPCPRSFLLPLYRQNKDKHTLMHQSPFAHSSHKLLVFTSIRNFPSIHLFPTTAHFIRTSST